LALTIWSCPCVELSLVVLEEGVCYDQCVLLKKLCLPFPCFILYSKAKLACYSRYLLTSYFCLPIHYDEKDIFFGVILVLDGLGGLHRTYKYLLGDSLKFSNGIAIRHPSDIISHHSCPLLWLLYPSHILLNILR